jgi:trehalose 6-phosphate phosphatase
LFSEFSILERLNSDPTVLAAKEEASEVLGRLVDEPHSSGIFTDFDGTLSTIVEQPFTARPLNGVPEVLECLVKSFNCVAVISGRPVEFLVERLGRDLLEEGLNLVGLHGLERMTNSGEVAVAPEAVPFQEALSVCMRTLRDKLPESVLVEDNGWSIAVHWRNNPALAEGIESLAREQASLHGLAVHPGRKLLELRPPIEVSKGSALRLLAYGLEAACFLGDDAGDLAAFDMLDQLRDAAGMKVLKVAVASSESPDRLISSADIVVNGPTGALFFLRLLCNEVELKAVPRPSGHAD